MNRILFLHTILLTLVFATACGASNSNSLATLRQTSGAIHTSGATPTNTLSEDTHTPTPAPSPSLPVSPSAMADETIVTPVATATPTAAPTPTPAATTVLGSVLQPGQTWQSEHWALQASGFAWDSSHVHFVLTNQTGRTVLLPEFSAEAFRIETDTGELFAPCSIRGSGWYNTWWQTKGGIPLAPGEAMEWDWTFYAYDPEHRACDASPGPSTFSSNARTLTLHVQQLDNLMTDAHWRVEIPRP